MISKDSFSRAILDKLYQIGELTVNGLLPNNRTEAKMWRKVLGLHDKYEFSPKTFSSVLSRLKSQGLVAKHGKHRRSLWVLTKKGENCLDIISASLPKEDGVIRLVAFDIPEVERKKRDVIRYELVACGYKQFQKSMWVGYRPLPDKFVKLLDDLKLKNKVQIIGINKTGTMEGV